MEQVLDYLGNYVKDKNLGYLGNLETFTMLAPYVKPLQGYMKKRFEEREQRGINP